MSLLSRIKNKKDRFNSIGSIKNLLQKRLLIVIIALMLTALGAAITGVLFKAGVHLLEDWRLQLLQQIPAWIVLPTIGGIGGLISGTLISNFAPAASGSGVSQIIGFMSHKNVPMNIKVGIVKLFAGIVAIGSGFPLGPEGPAVQMGGSVAWQMAQWLKAPVAFRRVIVAAGGGAGIAAIFSAPIGGFIYAIEELLNSAKPLILLLVVVTTFWADTWADLLQAMGLDPSAGGFDKNLGFQVESEYNPIVSFLPIDLGYLIFLGIIIGILAELYCKYVISMQKKGNELLGKKPIFRMTLSGVILGGMYSALPETFHHFGELQYVIADGNADIQLALSTFIILFLTTGLAAASGAPGGLFFPMLTLGGAIGLTCGGCLEVITGYTPSSYVFAGMGAFVAGCSRTPITAMFLAFALTKNLLILKPILIASITSYLIARSFNEDSIYKRQLKLDVNKNYGGKA